MLLAKGDRVSHSISEHEEMKKILLISIISVIVVSAIGLPIFLNKNQDIGNPDLQVNLKSCEFKSYDETSGWCRFVIIFHVEPIGFGDRNQFQISYANITDGNERSYGEFHPVRNTTAEDYTYWLEFSLKEVVDPVELSITFAIQEIDLTGSIDLAVPLFSKKFRLYPVIPPEVIESTEEPIETANAKIMLLYNSSINNYDQVNLTLFSESSGNGRLEIIFSTYENFTAGKDASVESVTFVDVYLNKGENNLILPSPGLCKQFSEYQNGYLLIQHVNESLDAETIAFGLMPQIEYE